MASQQDLPRTVLPIPDREPQGLTTFDAKDPDTHYPPIQPLRPPAGAPNVLVVLLCSPTRAALLSGRNHHSVGFGAITEMATSAPGNNSLRPNSCAPLAEVLKLNGYATAQFGKCHEVPVWETSPVGPFNSWPSGGGGFEYFYGFIGGETNQYQPALYEGTTPVEPDRSPEEGYHRRACGRPGRS